MIGSQEIGFTIVSMTLSLTAVFIPLLLMGGLIGRLFREFAVTVSVAILMSGIVSLDPHPDDVRLDAAAAEPAGRESWLMASARSGIPALARCLCREAALVAAPPPVHDLRDGGDHGGDRLALHRHSQGVLPAAGQRPHSGHHRGGPGHLLHGDGRACARARPGGDRRSRCRHRLLLGRRQSDRQHRPPDDRPQADEPAQGERHRDHQPAAPGDRQGPRHRPVRAGAPGRPDRRAGEQDAVPVHPAGPQRRRAVPMGTRSCWRSSPRCRSCRT